MCRTSFQMITCYSVKPKCHQCGLSPQMWIIVVEYHNYIYNTVRFYLKLNTGFAWIVKSVKIVKNVLHFTVTANLVQL